MVVPNTEIFSVTSNSNAPLKRTTTASSVNGTGAVSDDDNVFLGMNMQHVVIFFLFMSLILLILLVATILKIRHVCVRRRKRRNQAVRSVAQPQTQIGGSTSSTPHNSRLSLTANNPRPKKSLISKMIARLDEFDALTPLSLTPGSLSSLYDNDSRNAHFRAILRRPNNNVSDDISMVPICSSNEENQPLIKITNSSPNLPNKNGTNDIIENNSNANNTMHQPSSAKQIFQTPLEDIELMSIDRTSATSSLDKRYKMTTGHPRSLDMLSNQNNRNTAFIRPMEPSTSSEAPYHCSLSDYLPSESNNSVQGQYDPLEQSTPKTPQWWQELTGGSNENSKLKANIRFEPSTRSSSSTESIMSSNLESPSYSIGADTGSPIDTTGSLADLSDSCYQASESDTSEGANKPYQKYGASTSSQDYPGKAGTSTSTTSYELELSPYEFEPSTSSINKRFLHRIEEVAEEYDSPIDSSSSDSWSNNRTAYSDTAYQMYCRDRTSPDSNDKHNQQGGANDFGSSERLI